MLKLLHEVGRSVAVLHDETLLFVYRYGAGWPKPHFHPLYAPSSTRVLTLHAPRDYVHHRGLMWSFGRVAPQQRPDEWVNFWEERERERDEDGQISWPRPLPDERRGTIRHTRFETLEPGRERAIIVSDHEWRRASDEKVLLHQRQTVTAHPIADNGWSFDLQWELCAADEPMLLFARSEEENQEPLANYVSTPYGLACQFARELNGGVLLSQGGEKRTGEQLCSNRCGTALSGVRWCDYSSPLDDDEAHYSSGGWAGLALMSHPENPRQPDAFFALCGNTTFLSATPVGNESLLISTQSPRVFRYRVYAHNGRGKSETLQNVYENFVADKKENLVCPADF